MNGPFPLGKTSTEFFLNKLTDAADTLICKMVGILDFSDTFGKVKPIR